MDFLSGFIDSHSTESFYVRFFFRGCLRKVTGLFWYCFLYSVFDCRLSSVLEVLYSREGRDGQNEEEVVVEEDQEKEKEEQVVELQHQ